MILELIKFGKHMFYSRDFYYIRKCRYWVVRSFLEIELRVVILYLAEEIARKGNLHFRNIWFFCKRRFELLHYSNKCSKPFPVRVLM